MFYEINYVVFNGYACRNKVCIIRAENEGMAEDLFNKHIKSKCIGQKVIDKYTVIKPCKDDVIIFDGICN